MPDNCLIFFHLFSLTSYPRVSLEILMYLSLFRTNVWEQEKPPNKPIHKNNVGDRYKRAAVTDLCGYSTDLYGYSTGKYEIFSRVNCHWL